MRLYPADVSDRQGNQSREADALADAALDRHLNRQRRIDKIFRGITRLFALLVLATFIGMAGALVQGAVPAFKAFGFGFLTTSHWDPVNQQFGALVPIFGTVVTSIIALLIAVPVSFGIAIFLTELAPRPLRGPLGIAIELLAAIPSIIYGMWGLFVFAPMLARNVEPWLTSHLGEWPIIGVLFQGPPIGIGILSAGLVLAIMITPFISAVMRDVFTIVPALLKESAYGLGATTWEVMWDIVLPHSRAGVIGGIMLGLGRALGETMAVTFVIGNAHDLTASLFMPGSTISSALANEFSEAVGELYTSSLIELGLILFVITFIVLAIAKFMLLQLRRKEGLA